MVLINKEKKFIFIHIPKCGGTTIKNTLSDYQDLSIKNCSINLQQMIFNTNNCLHYYHMNIEELIQNKIITEKELKEYFIFTFVRNPYEKYISYMNYFKNILIKLFSIVFFIGILLTYYFLFQKKNKRNKNIKIIIMMWSVVIFFTYSYFNKWGVKPKSLLSFIVAIFKNDLSSILMNKWYYKDSYAEKQVKNTQNSYLTVNGKRVVNFIGKQEHFEKDFNTILKKLNIKRKIKTKNKLNNFSSKKKIINKLSKKDINTINLLFKNDFDEFSYDRN